MVDRSNRRMMQNDRGVQIPKCGAGGSCGMQGVRLGGNAGGCGCDGGGMNADCRAMLRRLQTVEFSMYDTMLYLDIYPECKEALAYYCKLRQERDSLRQSLAKRCNRPVTATETDIESGWTWIDSPWPWDPAAN